MTAPKPAQPKSKTRDARIARRQEKRRLETPAYAEESARTSVRAMEIQKQLKAARLHNCRLFSKMMSHGLLHDKTAKYLRQRYSKVGQRAKFEAIVKAEKEGGNLEGKMMWKKLTETSYWQEEEQTVPGWARGRKHDETGRKAEDEEVTGAPDDEEEDGDADEEEVVKGKRWPKNFELVIR